MADVEVKRVQKEDRLSQLPDEILDHILSFLSIHEAARTSVLAVSWRHRWLSWLVVGDLDFNTARFLKLWDFKSCVCESPDIPSRCRHSYTDSGPGLPRLKFWWSLHFFRWVTMVLASHRDHVDEASVLNKLSIQYPLHLDKRWCHRQIDEWLSYAFTRRVRSLELDFLLFQDPKYIILDDESYVFPTRLVAETDNLSCLRSLSLSGVNVSKQDVDCFLSKFPSLEHLKVCNSRKLTSVEICSSHRALKHLEIIECDDLECANVRDTCLVSLMFSSVRKLELENNPKLVSVCVSHWYWYDGATLQMLSNSLSSLKILTLSLSYNYDEVFDQVPQLIELKQLTLVVAPLREDVFFRLITLLSLSPNLEKLVLEFVKPKFERKIEYIKVAKVPLQHLKAIEVRGYCGEEAEDELLIHVFEHVVAPIQRLIFDPHTLRRENVVVDRKGWEIKSDERRVDLLKRLVSSSTELIVL